LWPPLTVLYTKPGPEGPITERIGKMKTKAQILEMVKDPALSETAYALRKVKDENKDLRLVHFILDRRHIPLSPEIDAAIDKGRKAEAALENTLEDVYGLVWQDYEELFRNI